MTEWGADNVTSPNSIVFVHVDQLVTSANDPEHLIQETIAYTMAALLKPVQC